MRLVKVQAPEGKGRDVMLVAFNVGIKEVSFRQEQTFRRNEPATNKDVVDISTSTSKAKEFTDALLSAEFFNSKEFSISNRQPQSIVSDEQASKITLPVAMPTVDVFEELWQFSHITYSFIIRILIAALLLSYGMIQFNLLLMIAGLMFLPFLPLLLAISFGVLTKEWRLALQGLLAFIVGTGLIVAGGAIVAMMTSPPLKYQEFSFILTGFLISIAVGVAAGFATADDVGRRELIGLAATAQIALIPAWFGISLVFGFSQIEPPMISQRIISFLVNIVTIIAVSLITYLFLGMNKSNLKRYT